MPGMELPISPSSYQASPDALIRAAKRAAVVLGRTIADEATTDAGTLLSNPQRAGVWAANFVGDMTVPDDASPREAIEQILTHYRERGATCYALDAADTFWPDAVPPILSSLGYYPSNRMVCLWDRTSAPVPPPSPDLQIIPARASYRELAAFFREMATTQDRCSDEQAAALAKARVDQLDEERLEVFLGRLDGKAVGVCGVLTLGNVGVLYDLFTLASHRNRGVGAGLMAHLLDHCRRAQFDSVVASFPQNCPHLPFYTRLGFSVVGTFIRFRRRGD